LASMLSLTTLNRSVAGSLSHSFRESENSSGRRRVLAVLSLFSCLLTRRCAIVQSCSPLRYIGPRKPRSNLSFSQSPITSGRVSDCFGFGPYLRPSSDRCWLRRATCNDRSDIFPGTGKDVPTAALCRHTPSPGTLVETLAREAAPVEVAKIRDLQRGTPYVELLLRRS